MKSKAHYNINHLNDHHIGNTNTRRFPLIRTSFNLVQTRLHVFEILEIDLKPKILLLYANIVVLILGTMLYKHATTLNTAQTQPTLANVGNPSSYISCSPVLCLSRWGFSTEISSVYISASRWGFRMRSLIITFLAEESNALNSAVCSRYLASKHIAFDCLNKFINIFV
jgi:hypothetical protein